MLSTIAPLDSILIVRTGTIRWTDRLDALAAVGKVG